MLNNVGVSSVIFLLHSCCGRKLGSLLWLVTVVGLYSYSPGPVVKNKVTVMFPATLFGHFFLYSYYLKPHHIVLLLSRCEAWSLTPRKDPVAKGLSFSAFFAQKAKPAADA